MKIDIDLSLLEILTEDTKPLWGKMTARHMLEHIIAVVKSSNGQLVFEECMNPPAKYPLLKRFLLGNRPMPKEFVNTVIGEGLKPLIHNSVEEAKIELNVEVNRFYTYFKKNSNSKPLNPTFGPLNFEEWIVFHNKHFAHHFAQFALIKE